MNKRIIKFRAWDNVNKRMGYFHPGFDWNDEYDHWYLSPVEWSKRITDVPCGDNINLMQFTGLLDKNGKEIYEGDIVRIKDCEIVDTIPVNGEWKEIYADCVGNIHYAGSWFCFDGHSAGDLPLEAFDSDKLEVIGNVHENPELVSEPLKTTKTEPEQ